MIGKKIVRAAVLALAVAAPMSVATGTAQAAPADGDKAHHADADEGSTADFTLKIGGAESA
jgi:hypothetical protein